MRWSRITRLLLREYGWLTVEAILWGALVLAAIRIAVAVGTGWSPDELLEQLLPSLRFVAAPPGNPISPLTTYSLGLWTVAVAVPKVKGYVQGRRSVSEEQKGKTLR